MPNADVAVMLPVYSGDAPTHFRKALSSLVNQTYPACSLHIFVGVDGPIPNDLEQVLEEYDNEIEAVNRLLFPQGLATNLNQILIRAREFPYIARMDADDISRPYRIEKQVCFLEANPDVQILGTAINEFYPDDRAFERFYPRSNSVRQSIARGSPLAHPTVMFRSTIFEKIKGYPKSRSNEDVALWFEALSVGIKIDNLPDVCLDFRISKSFQEKRGTKKALDELRVYITGIRALGLPWWNYIFPVLRFIYRLAPATVRARIFESRWRRVS